MISSSNSSQSIWPVATMKLLSPASKACPREPTEEVTMTMIVETMNTFFILKTCEKHHSPIDIRYAQDPGHLVIDEDGMSSEGQGPMTMSPLDVDYDMNYLNDDTPPAPGMVKTIGANGKVEWKRLAFLKFIMLKEKRNQFSYFARYKQYTKDDILAAIEEVKNGMSALQASRKYGVPSRTLYDKVETKFYKQF